MANFMMLWFAIRKTICLSINADTTLLTTRTGHTTGSAYLYGKEMLDMEPEVTDGSYPLYGKVSMPRMIIAQFDNLNILQILDPLREKTMSQLDDLLGSDNKDAFFTVYVTVFVLLYEVSLSTADRQRHGQANGTAVSSLVLLIHVLVPTVARLTRSFLRRNTPFPSMLNAFTRAQTSFSQVGTATRMALTLVLLGPLGRHPV